MILTIDRVLQLLAEGKDIAKVAELAEVSEEDVRKIVNEIREILRVHERDRSRKKILIRKKKVNADPLERIKEWEAFPAILDGAELSAVPVEEKLTFYVAVSGKDEKCGVAIVIHDAADRQVCKLGYILRKINDREALLRAVIRSYEIAKYFRAAECKVRTHDATFVNQLNGKIIVQDLDLRKKIDEFAAMREGVQCVFKLEVISEFQNEKTIYVAAKAIEG